VVFNPTDPTSGASREEPFFHQLLHHIEWKLLYQSDCSMICQVIFETTPPPTLLVIDDNEGLGLLLERYLSGRRCRLVYARSGLDGIQLARQLEPDAVILDVMMPGLDGWQVLKRLKTEESTREIPVIICSVFDDPRLARSLGATQLLPKPLQRDAFIEAIRQVGL
jgi:CheY-like chemotaxis protein